MSLLSRFCDWFSAKEPPKRRGGRPAKLPWRSTPVGGSFLAPERFTSTLQFGSQASQMGKRWGLKFKCETVEMEGQRRVRVTRVA